MEWVAILPLQTVEATSLHPNSLPLHSDLPLLLLLGLSKPYHMPSEEGK